MDKSKQKDWARTKRATSFPTFQLTLRVLFIIGLFSGVLLSTATVFADKSKAEVELSSEEEAWLRAHPVILHAPDPDYAPFEYKNKHNRYVGVAPDFLKKIGTVLGVRFEAIPSPSWSASLENIKQHKADLVTVATKTPERSEYMLFTSPYMVFQNLILVHEDVGGYFILKDLAGQTIAGIKGWAITEYIEKHHPDIQIHWVADVKSALEAVSDRTADALLLNRATAGYWMAKTEITDLRIAGETHYTYKLSFASRKDWPLLNRLLEKALNNISQSEREAVIQKWTFSEKQGWRTDLHLWGVLTAITAMHLFVGILIRYLSLRRRIRQRTRALYAK